MIGIAVSIPLINPQLKVSTAFEGRIAALVNAGETSLSVDNIGFSIKNLDYPINMNLETILLKGDRIELGPSSSIGHLGLNEVLTVLSVSGDTIEVTTPLQNTYDVKDIVIGIGRGIAGGWHTTEYETLGIHSFPLISDKNHFLLDVPSDFYYQKLKLTIDNLGAVSSKTAAFKQTLSSATDENERNLIEQTKYRFGMIYKSAFNLGGVDKDDLGAGENSFDIVVSDGETNFLTNSQVQDLQEVGDAVFDDWHFFEAEGITGIYTNFGEQFISINSTIKSSVNATTLMNFNLDIDTMFLEHAKNTDGEDAGIYFFTDDGSINGNPIFPDNGIIWRNLNQSTTVNLNDKSSINYNTEGITSKRWAVTFNFSHVPESFLVNLDKLLEWQRRGHNLILHTDQETLADSEVVITPEIDDNPAVLFDGQSIKSDVFPPYIVGQLSYNSTSRPFRELDFKNITITFTEIINGF